MSLLRKKLTDYIKKALFNNQGKWEWGGGAELRKKKKNQACYFQENFQISSGASQEASFQLQNPNNDLGYGPDYFLAF